MDFIKIHYTSTEDWYVNPDAISAIRENHDKEDSHDNGVWVYLKGDTNPIKVTDTLRDIMSQINI